MANSKKYGLVRSFYISDKWEEEEYLVDIKTGKFVKQIVELREIKTINMPDDKLVGNEFCTDTHR